MDMGRRTTSHEQRVAIGELARAGKTDREIGQMLSLRRSVVRKWRRRGQGKGMGRRNRNVLEPDERLYDAPTVQSMWSPGQRPGTGWAEWMQP